MRESRRREGMQNHAPRGPTGALGVLTVTGGPRASSTRSARSRPPRRSHGVATPPKNPDYAFGIVGGSPTVLIDRWRSAVLALFVVVVGPLAARFGDLGRDPGADRGRDCSSNTLDRIRLGGVRDFIVTPWAIINVADLCVIAGLVGLVIAPSCDRARVGIAALRIRPVADPRRTAWRSSSRSDAGLSATPCVSLINGDGRVGRARSSRPSRWFPWSWRPSVITSFFVAAV